MKTKAYAALAAAAVLGVGLGAGSAAAQAQQDSASGLALAQQENCMSCHSVKRTFMGPALHDVAARYATLDAAPAYLKRKILDGSVGIWGEVPMPANTQLTPDQAATLASWIMTLK